MARTSLKPIEIPEGISLENKDKNLVFSGKLGEMSLMVHKDVDIKQENNSIYFSPNKETKQSLAITGTMRALASNMIEGVGVGFEKKLELKGVGYRAKADKLKVELTVGYSHPVHFEIPKGISIETPSQTEIVISGVDKQQVGQVAADIRSVRPPEPYKGKGIKYSDEEIVKKEAKKK